MTAIEYRDSIGWEPVVDEPPDELETVRLRRRIVVLEKVNVEQGQAIDRAIADLSAGVDGNMVAAALQASREPF